MLKRSPKASKLVRLMFGKNCFSSTNPTEKPSETNWKATLFAQSVNKNEEANKCKPAKAMTRLKNPGQFIQRSYPTYIFFPIKTLGKI